jgi:ankyrin repeat protein
MRLTWGIAPLIVFSLGAAAPLTLVDAVKNGDLAAVRVAVQQPHSADAAEADGTSALHWAVRQDRGDIVTVLLTAGANPSPTNRFGVTPLALACENGAAAIVTQLLQAGADATAPLKSGETPLMTAARTGTPDVVKALLVRQSTCASRRSNRHR